METYEFLQDVADTVRPLILEVFDTDSCIATTRVVIDVLDYFGIVAKPLPVELVVMNREALKIFEDAGMEALSAAIWANTAETVGGPWTVGLGLVMDGKWDGGHLVAAVPSLRSIVDASVDQVSRPLKNIEVGPLALQVEDPAFLTTPEARESFKVCKDGGEPVSLVYSHSPHKQYTRSPNWRRKSASVASEAFRDITASAIRSLRGWGV